MGKFYDIVKILLLIKISLAFAQESRIVGGVATTIDHVPYLVQLLDNGRFFCGGTLVKPNFVVTAAHCVQGVPPGRLTVVAGASRLTDAGVRSKVYKVMTPNAFSRSTMNVDVAVLKLSTPLTGQNVKTIGLCSKSWSAGASLKVSGWGLTAENSNSVSQQVRTVNVNAIAKDTCATRYRGVSSLTASMTCASVPGLKDACLGDSGGPAILNGELCGIVSWGVGCARNAYPGVYTNVVNVRQFINNCLAK